MIIRRQQMEVFGDYMRRQFEWRMVHHLRARFPNETMLLDEDSLQDLVVSGIRQAEDYGIDVEEDIRRYLEYMMVLSRDFDTNPHTAWASDILRRGNIDGSRKMDEIDNAYVFTRG